MAQEVEQVVPEMEKVVDEEFGDQEITDFRLLTSSDFVPILVRAVQELKAANDNQAAMIEDLRTRVEALEAQN